MVCDARKRGAKAKAAKGGGAPFVRGNAIGKKTRFRRKEGRYRGACRWCGSDENTRNAGKDWFCRTCHKYTRKRRGRKPRR